jgi:hypothetical protein
MLTYAGAHLHPAGEGALSDTAATGHVVIGGPGTQCACFTGTKVQKKGTQFTCFTGTKVQILTLRARPPRRLRSLLRGGQLSLRGGQLSVRF